MDQEAADWLSKNAEICGVCQYPLTETENNNHISRKSVQLAVKRGLLVQENLRVNVEAEWGEKRLCELSKPEILRKLEKMDCNNFFLKSTLNGFNGKRKYGEEEDLRKM